MTWEPNDIELFPKLFWKIYINLLQLNKTPLKISDTSIWQIRNFWFWSMLSDMSSVTHKFLTYGSYQLKISDCKINQNITNFCIQIRHSHFAHWIVFWLWQITFGIHNVYIIFIGVIWNFSVIRNIILFSVELFSHHIPFSHYFYMCTNSIYASFQLMFVEVLLSCHLRFKLVIIL